MNNFWDEMITNLTKHNKTQTKENNRPIKTRFYLKNSNSKYLTNREYQCFNLIKQGLTMQQAGDVLDLSARTVEFYLKNAKNRLRIRSTKELIINLKNNHFEEKQV